MMIKSIIQTSKIKFFLPLLFLAACTGTPKDDGTSPTSLYQQPRSYPANPYGGYVVNPVTGDSIQPIVNRSGDTLITGVPIPTQGKRIPPYSVAKPKAVKWVVLPFATCITDFFVSLLSSTGKVGRFSGTLKRLDRGL